MTEVNYFSIACSLTVPLSDRRVLRSRAYREAASAAGAVVLDLEDSVPRESKPAARAFFAEAFDHFAELNSKIYCRINGGSEYLYADLEVCARKPLAGLQLPKVASADDIGAVRSALREFNVSSFDLVPIIECLDGVQNIESILQTHRPKCVYFGPEDMSLELGVEPSAESLWYVAHKLLFEAARFKIPVFGVLGPLCYHSARDAALFTDLLGLSKRVGFQGAPAVHPRQVKMILECFRVSEDERALLRKLTEREAKRSIFSLDGIMYGPPMIKRLRKRVERS